ncbi:MAG: (Fe-S)-binding protein [Dehalococcoidales bacterium]|nr:MAG: (Fe-S)-binding protein [Dehalococcoidales bacterium]
MSKKLIPPGLTYLANNIALSDNIIGAAKRDGSKWAKIVKFSGNTETVFFAGCGYQYSSELETLMSLIRSIDKSPINTEMTMNLAIFQRKLGLDLGGVYRKVMTRGGEADSQPLISAVKVLNKIGIDLGYLGEDEPCCGGLLYYIGMHSEFNSHSKDVYSRLKAKGVKEIISLVPSCTFTLKSLVPKGAGNDDIKVKHFCEVVDGNLASLKLQLSEKVKVTYHDPCQLSRSLGLIDEPRRILSAIKNVELVEPAWTKGKFSTCCGGGGGFEAVFPELSHTLAVNRATELTETDPDIIVTHCPGCIMQIEGGLEELGINDVQVLDLAQVVGMALEV